RASMTDRRSPERPQPHIVTGDGTTSPAHRLLLITAAFPPDPRSGSLRWQKLSRFVAERGWGLDVITTDPAEIEFPDAALVKELPSGIRVFGMRSSPPHVERFLRGVWQVYRGRSPRESGTGSATSVDGMRTPAAAAPRNDRPESLGRSEIQWSLRSPRGLVRAFTSLMDFARWRNW